MDSQNWIKRFETFKKLNAKLLEITDNHKKDSLTEIERDSLIKRFELTFELSWNVLKDFLEAQGSTDLYGSKNTFKTAFQRGLIDNGELWMEMIQSRVLSAHVYDEENAIEIASNIYDSYISLFDQLKNTMTQQLED